MARSRNNLASQLEKHSGQQDEQVRNTRALERQVEELKAKLAVSESKRKQAESDLDIASTKSELFTSTNNKILTNTYHKLDTKQSGEATAIICANDWHVEERVDEETCNGLNKYDLEIASARIEKLWQKSVYWLNHSRQISNVKDCVLWLGGDFISGYIHEELEENNLLSPTQAILFVQNKISSGIDHLLKYGDITGLRIVCNFGNHGRTTRKMRFATGYKNSYEWLAYNNISDRYRDNPKVSFHIASGYHALVNIQGWKVRFHHGDAIRYWGGVGGITVPVNKAISQWNKSLHADWDIFGHWHQFHRDWKWVCCGCLIGLNSFGIQTKQDYQPPTQTYMVIDKRRGLVTAEPIFVDESQK